jgi:hypothetical protein
MDNRDEIHDRIRNGNMCFSKSEKELAQRLLDHIHSHLVCDSALYGMALEKIQMVEEMEKRGPTLISRKKSLDKFIQDHISNTAYIYGLKDPSEPESEPKLKLVVNNK